MQIAHHPTPFTPAKARAEGFVSATIGLLLIWQERARQRHALGRLDDRALKDIGLTRADVSGESGKPFWRG